MVEICVCGPWWSCLPWHTLLSAGGLMRAHSRALLLWARASFARCCALVQFCAVLRVLLLLIIAE